MQIIDSEQARVGCTCVVLFTVGSYEPTEATLGINKDVVKQVVSLNIQSVILLEDCVDPRSASEAVGTFEPDYTGVAHDAELSFDAVKAPVPVADENIPVLSESDESH